MRLEEEAASGGVTHSSPGSHPSLWESPGPRLQSRLGSSLARPGGTSCSVTEPRQLPPSPEPPGAQCAGLETGDTGAPSGEKLLDKGW